MSTQYEDVMARSSFTPHEIERHNGQSIMQRRGMDFEGKLIATGLVALALGGLAWYYFGPDLRRYLKIRSM
jgi:hypothetical protein